MADKYVFSDEAGCFTFKRQEGASKYFYLCTIGMEDCSISGPLLDIKRKLVSSGDITRKKLHATSDSQETRDAVFEVLRSHEFHIDVTILEKSKSQPQTRIDQPTFFKYAWYYHFKHVGPKLCQKDKKTLITAASLGTKKNKAIFKAAVNDSAQQVVPRDRWEISFIDSSEDPCLWAADYCAWAIQRKWEMGDERSYDIIKPKVATEYDLWRLGKNHYY
jgi:hypothetical protein